MTVARTICLGFAAVIVTGALLLLLPGSIVSGQWGNPIEALYMATSAVCVTGLAIVDPGSYYTVFGQAVLALLAQIGGLGYMTASTVLMILLGRKFNLKDKIALQQSLDAPGLDGLKRLITSIIAVTMICELTGAFLLMTVFVPQFGWSKGIWFGLFHSVSAFNNAGFGLLPDNLVSYVNNPIVIGTIGTLIIVGGIGYPVIMEAFVGLRDRRKNPLFRWSLHLKVVVTTTLLLLSVGTIAFWGTEINNPKTLEPLSASSRLLAAWFQSVTTRTAGFNSIPIGDMTTAGLFITIAWMFIGASPGSTGGGVKTTTFSVLQACTVAVLRGRDDVVCYERRLPTGLILKAVGVVFGSGLTVVVSTMLLALVDSQFEFLPLLFEATSAFGTVGLSMGISAQLSIAGKLIIIATMYIGRVGVLLLISALFGDPEASTLRYPEDQLLVG
jgi:trk system potassium uptake protein